MKILHLIDSAGVYGAEIMLLGLMGEQARRGDRPLLASIGVPGTYQKPLELEARRQGVPVEEVRMRPGPNIPGALKIVRLARQQGCRLIHTHGYKANVLIGMLPRKLRGVPVVATLHGWTCTGGWNRMRLYQWADRMALRFLDQVVAVDEATAAKVAAKEVVVVPNGIASSRWSTGAQADGDIVSFCGEGTVFGTVGRLSAEKGHEHLLEAFALLAPCFPELRLLVLGDGPLRVQLEEKARDLGVAQKILFSGYRKDAPRYLPLLKAFVLSSLTEGLPMVVLEAMQAGVPVVATAVGGVPGLLQGGEAGILVEDGSAEGIARGMRTVLEDPRLAERLAARAREAVRPYDVENMALRYQAVYREVVYRWGPA